MFIKSFEISNYKCFDSSGNILLGPGIVVLTGQNGSGKTTALEALSLQFRFNPHRSLNKAIAEIESSSISVTSKLLREELLEIAGAGSLFVVPAPRPGSSFLQELGIRSPANLYQLSSDAESQFLLWFFRACSH